ncbi:MAG: cell surface protein, partial [Bacteroidota bacterium]
EKTNQSPDLALFKAEIAEYLNDENAKIAALEDFDTNVQNNLYGVMYNTHTIELHVENAKRVDTALEIAKNEIMNRSTPETYDLLAYSYFKDGDTGKALELMEKHVQGKTFEPMAQYHMAQIYKANGNLDMVQSIKKELEEASFELGPNMVKAIQEL